MVSEMSTGVTFVPRSWGCDAHGVFSFTTLCSCCHAIQSNFWFRVGFLAFVSKLAM